MNIEDDRSSCLIIVAFILSADISGIFFHLQEFELKWVELEAAHRDVSAFQWLQKRISNPMLKGRAPPPSF